MLDLVINLSFTGNLILIFIQFGFCKQLDTWGVDGEALHVNLPSEEEASTLVSTSEKQYKERLGMCLLKSFYLLIYILSCGIDIVFSSLSLENKHAFERYNRTSIKYYSWIGYSPCYFCAILSIHIFTLHMGFPRSWESRFYCMGFSSPAPSPWASGD